MVESNKILNTPSFQQDEDSRHIVRASLHGPWFSMILHCDGSKFNFPRAFGQNGLEVFRTFLPAFNHMLNMENKANSGNTVVETAEKTTVSTKKVAKSKAGTPLEKSSHPPTSEMVTAAIKELKDRKGSSLQAIKKYIASTYKVDGEKSAPFIKRYLKSAVASGAIVQTKGTGASGSFKLSTAKITESPKAKKAATRPAKKATPKKTRPVEKKTAPKKSAGTNKPAQAKKAVAEKKTATPKKTAAKPAIKSKATTEAKSMSKTKKNAKAPAAKTKVPKPKKAAAPKAKAAAKK